VHHVGFTMLIFSALLQHNVFLIGIHWLLVTNTLVTGHKCIGYWSQIRNVWLSLAHTTAKVIVNSSVSICVHVCLCVCLCVWGGGVGGQAHLHASTAVTPGISPLVLDWQQTVWLSEPIETWQQHRALHLFRIIHQAHFGKFCFVSCHSILQDC
jgi:hypothetical protein